MIRLRNIALATASIIVLFFLFVASSEAWHRAHMHYPSPENESSFLRQYSLKRVVEPYVDSGWGSSEGRESGGEAGTTSVTHTRGFDEYFTIRSERKGTLMVAVNHDVEEWLRMTGASIRSQNGTSSSGFLFKYTSGKSVGSVSIHPLAPGIVHRNMPLQDGLEDIALSIQIKEEWFPNGVPAELARALPQPAQ